MHVRRLMSFALAGSFALAVPVLASAECIPKNNPPINVQPGPDGKGKVSAEVVTACEGETLRWVFTGPEGDEMVVIFTSVEDSPFEWDRLTGRTVTGTVKKGAAKQGQETPYDYVVEINGQPVDPRIIIQP